MAAENFGDFAIHLHQTDDVAVTKRQLKRGVELVNGSIHLTAAQNIPPGHKVAVHEIPDGSPVRKYGQIIGFANGRIAAGDHVHLHNLAVKDFGRDYEFCAEARPVKYYSPEKMRAFQGYSRSNGRAGTRNYLAVISSVNCSAATSHYVANHFKTPGFQRDFPNVDGVIAFTHKSGCAMPIGEGHKLLQRVLAGIARHPNISGYVMIGLGCEVNQIQAIAKDYNLEQLRPGELAPSFMTVQGARGIRKTVEAGVAAVGKLLPL